MLLLIIRGLIFPFGPPVLVKYMYLLGTYVASHVIVIRKEEMQSLSHNARCERTQRHRQKLERRES